LTSIRIWRRLIFQTFIASPDPSITFEGPSYAYTANPSVFPTGFYPVGGYYGPNLEFGAATTTPEPGLYAVLTLGLIGLAATLRRRKAA
jgi:hypothetical protein